MKDAFGQVCACLPDEERGLLKDILSLVSPPKSLLKLCNKGLHVSIFESGFFKDSEVRWLLLVFRTLLLRYLKPGSKFHTDTAPKILFPADRHFYEEHRLNLPENISLREIFGPDCITYTLSTKITTALYFVANYKERGPRRTHALFLIDPRNWVLRQDNDPTPAQERLDILLAKFFVVAQSPWSLNGDVVFRNNSKNISVDDFDPRPLQEELDRINDSYPDDVQQLFRLSWIWGKTPMEHNRLYSRFCSVEKRIRKIYLKGLDLEESDITAAYWRILYLLYTGSPFSHEGFGEDLYTYLASKAWPEYPHPEHYRSIVKHILAISIGDKRNHKTDSMLNKVSEELAKIGVGIGKTEHREFVSGSAEIQGSYRTVKLTPSLLDKRWSKFCTNNIKKIDEYGDIPRPDIDPKKFIDALFSEAVVRDNVFIQVFKLGMWVETLCNIQLLEWGRSQGIVIATIHDGCYAPRQHIEEVRVKQDQFLRIAAGVYRKILAYQKEYHNRRKLMGLTEDQRRSIARDCLSECSESIQQVYENVVMYFFTPAKKSEKRRQSSGKKQDEHEAQECVKSQDPAGETWAVASEATNTEEGQTQPSRHDALPRRSQRPPKSRPPGRGRVSRDRRSASCRLPQPERTP